MIYDLKNGISIKGHISGKLYLFFLPYTIYQRDLTLMQMNGLFGGTVQMLSIAAL